MESHREINVVVEDHIPFIKGLLEPYANVRYLAPEAITPEAVADADALFVRTRTRCDEALLGGSRCRFVATATIGTDHIDLPWCASQGIVVSNAPGCNAPAVARYVMASLLALARRPINECTIGIIGVGHVGSIVEHWARQLGMRVLVNDPPRQAAEGGDQWCTLDRIAAEADIVTVHTPLDDSTRHLIGRDFLARVRRTPVIVNAARGAVVDTRALVEALEDGRVKHAVIDCWEGEPNISVPLLRLADVATPHIAGYSREGKVRATRMVLDAFAAHFGLPRIEMPESVPAGAAENVTAESIAASYDPLADTAALKAAFLSPKPGVEPTAAFEALRNNYNLRREVV